MAYHASPLTCAFAITCVLLILNLLVLWVLSGVERTRAGVAVNPEDGAKFMVPISEIDPPMVARLLRAHRNAEATIYPFIIAALVYLAIGGSAIVAVPIFFVFAVARLSHSYFYIRAIQPWRTIAFVASVTAILAMILAIVIRLIAA